MRPTGGAMPAMLEINRIPQRDLDHLLEAIGQHAVERELNVHRTTVQRWQRGLIRIPGAKHQAIRMLLGDLPGTAGEWFGWRFWKGELWSPGGDRFSAGDVLAIGLQRQQIAALQAELKALRTAARSA